MNEKGTDHCSAPYVNTLSLESVCEDWRLLYQRIFWNYF